MRFRHFFLGILSLSALILHPDMSLARPSPARVISSREQGVDEPNTWIAFRKDVSLYSVPKEVILKVGADSKYWLWVNGKLAVFEGGLKRGPAPDEGYYDEVDIAGFLHPGKNRIAVLVWYFGKSGFSHLSSGKSALVIDSQVAAFRTNSSWKSRIHPAYGEAEGPVPNYRLSEANILFDATKDFPGDWITGQADGFMPSLERGSWGEEPWGRLSRRPIPMWKDHGIKSLSFDRFPIGGGRDSVIARLPYNMQMTPILDLKDDEGGSRVMIYTDHSFAGAADNIHAQYITKKGSQQYESLGWMNGEKILLSLPSDVTLTALSYRETGYDTAVQGHFSSSDPFLNRFWEKALRTLYVNMRDTFFDCPDRERAQWWGDVTVLMGESFYSYSSSVHLLMKKAILELCAHQRDNGVLYSPIPGTWRQELPGQMLASIGEYGFWNYYMNTGDIETLRKVYPSVKKYLSLWEVDGTGLTQYRVGGWNWGDWGDNKDVRLLHAGWHCLALQGAGKMARELGYERDAEYFRELEEGIKRGFNLLWNGYAYRDPSYQGQTDDRAQALAVLAGIATPDKYERIIDLLRSQKHASPYMEKYVLEALFVMGEGEYAMERFHERFSDMVLSEEFSTLYEGWDVGSEEFGGGTTNHAWSGGPLTVVARYLCGIAPLEAGWKRFEIRPAEGCLDAVDFSFGTVSGEIGIAWNTDSSGNRHYKIKVPQGTVATFFVGNQEKTLEGGVWEI